MRITLYSWDGRISIPKSLEQNADLNNSIAWYSQSILKPMQNETLIIKFQLYFSCKILQTSSFFCFQLLHKPLFLEHQFLVYLKHTMSGKCLFFLKSLDFVIIFWFCFFFFLMLFHDISQSYHLLNT